MKPYISVVVKPTLFCNESCSHCYHTPEERVPGEMDIATLDRLMRMVSEEYESAWFIWHGGEPMTLPMSFYKNAIALEEKHFGKNSFRVGNTIQTNGTLLNRRFMAYCREKAINVGVSCEGPCNSVLRELDPSKAISMLSDKDNKYSVSSTISSQTALRQREIYEFYRDRGTNLSLSPVIPAGCAKGSGLVPDPDEYIRGSIEAFDAWLHDSESKIPLVPHYLYVLNYLGDPTPSDCSHASCLTKWICVNPDGTIYPCAKACPPEFAMGNVNEIEHLADAFRSEGFRRILEGSIARREKCMSCPVYRNCNGGCSMDAYHDGGIENNNGDSCRIFREVFAHVSSEVQAILDGEEDVASLNPFVRDAIVGKLVNPRTVSQRGVLPMSL
ncbi:MAG: radical SAM protein [Thermoplasmata archaeon]|nr:radical SAM protein [Thermoplasmata archaeon]